MKTASLIIALLLPLSTTSISLNYSQFDSETLTGVYDGLTEYLEFQFTSIDGQIFLFDEMEADLEYDLYDEMLIDQKFKVTWEKRVVEILDEEDEPTGKNEEIKIILGLQKL